MFSLPSYFVSQPLAQTHKLPPPPPPVGHISEVDGSSLSLNKNGPLKTDGFVQMAPNALKSWNGNAAVAYQTHESRPAFAVETKQKDTCKYWIAPPSTRHHPWEKRFWTSGQGLSNIPAKITQASVSITHLLHPSLLFHFHLLTNLGPSHV